MESPKIEIQINETPIFETSIIETPGIEIKKVKIPRGAKKHKRITVEAKKDIIIKHENGVRVSDLAMQYDMAKSTICTILKNKDALKTADVAKGVTILTKQRSRVLEETEKILLLWINEKQLAGETISEGQICEKALLLHNELLVNMPNSDGSVKDFKASRGWLEKFRRRSGLLSDVRRRHPANVDSEISNESFQIPPVIKTEVDDDEGKRKTFRDEFFLEDQSNQTIDGDHVPAKMKLNSMMFLNNMFAEGNFRGHLSPLEVNVQMPVESDPETSNSNGETATSSKRRKRKDEYSEMMKIERHKMRVLEKHMRDQDDDLYYFFKSIHGPMSRLPLSVQMNLRLKIQELICKEIEKHESINVHN